MCICVCVCALLRACVILVLVSCLELLSLFHYFIPTFVCVFTDFIKAFIHIIFNVIEYVHNYCFAVLVLCFSYSELDRVNYTVLGLKVYDGGILSLLLIFIFLCWCLIIWSYDN